MNRHEFEAVRRLLFLSNADVAEWLDIRIRAVQRWQAGVNPLPDYAAEVMQCWLDVYRQAKHELDAQIDALQAKHGKAIIALLIYSNQEDFAIEDGEWETPFQIFNAVNAAVFAVRDNVRLVKFDAQSYFDWVMGHGYADSRMFRSQWAASQVSSG